MKQFLVTLFLCLPTLLLAGPLPESSPNGILVDRVLPMAHLDELDGSPTASAANLSRWRQTLHELRRSAAAPLGWPEPHQFQPTVLAKSGATHIPLALINARYDRMTAKGDTEAGLVFAFAALDENLYEGADVRFVLDARQVFTHGASPLTKLTLDAADGRGPRALRPGLALSVSYGTTGTKTLALKAETSAGQILTARALITVKRLVTPTPTEIWPVTATESFGGSFASGQAYVYLAPGHTTLSNPVVVVEGFDLDNTMDWPVLYDLLNQQNLLEDLRAAGFDAVVLDFTDATEPIERNAYVLTELLAQVNATIAAGRSSVVIGASMGGLVSRYALSWLEQNTIDHRVRTYLSFDSPHGGANIPLGVQHWLRFFQGESTDAAFLLSRLNTPAARQMLLYHQAATSGTTPAPAPERAAWLANLTAAGDWPQTPRRVAVANGSGTGQDQGFAPREQIIAYEYRSLLIDIDGDVWAVPDGGGAQVIFDGGLNLIWPLPDTYETVSIAGSIPWDSAPGGSRNSMAQMDATNPSYGDIIALHPDHCFIPTVSALALDTNDPFFAIASNPDLESHTPFDTVYWPATNEGHIAITVENRQWFLSEIEAGISAVGEMPATPTAILHQAAPNPFNPVTTIHYELAEQSPVELSIYDLSGRLVTRLRNGERELPGQHKATWYGRNSTGQMVAAGVYLYRLQAGEYAATRRVTLVK